MPSPYIPIVYVRGYAGIQSEVEETVDDPFYGFNAGSTHIRQDQTGKAEFFAFQSPFVRLARDHGYSEVFDGANQVIPAAHSNPDRTVWIYRFYDATSQTFDRPGGRRLTIEEAAGGLAEFIESVLHQPGVTATKVILIAHSMGGLVCRSLIQKHYPENGIAPDSKIDKLFTYGTPHKGINFDLGYGVIEKLRDRLGVNHSDDFGPERMYRYLTPKKLQKKKIPKTWDAASIPPTVFNPDRIFCIVGTNARDYEVAHGLSRSLVGPQSDGLVQMERAYVRGAHRAYIHRSHSGRYGMVNSEEGYQNLQRFLFGDVKVRTTLCNLDLNYHGSIAGRPGATVTYLFEVQVAVRGLVILMHERSLAHLSAIPLNQSQFIAQMKKGGLPLFTSFLMTELALGGTMRYMLRIGVYSQTFEKGGFFTADHIEHLPLWSDYLVIELRRAAPGGSVLYDPFYSWASERREPATGMVFQDVSEDQTDAFVDLPERGREILGPAARVKFETYYWNR